MASKIGMTLRNDAAQKRLRAAIETIETAGGPAIPPIPHKTNDRHLNETLQREWVADSLEVIAANADDLAITAA